MLIDLTRRPIRVIYGESPKAVIFRTMKIPGGADGLIHQEVVSTRRVLKTLAVAAQSKNGEATYQEAILPCPDAWKRAGYANEPFHTVTAYQDLITKRGDVWRINIGVERATNSKFILSLLDETHGHTLFTIQADDWEPGIKITTPLSRLHQKNSMEEFNVFTELLQGDFLES